MRWASLLTLFFLILVVSPLASQQQVPDDKLIIPGVRIGKYPLEASVDDLTRLVGFGPRGSLSVGRGTMTITDTPAPYTEVTWFLEKGTLNAQFRDRSRIETLDFSWSSALSPNDPPEFQTGRGITFRSRRADVETAYGPPTWDDTYGVTGRGDRCTPPAAGCQGPFTFTAYNTLGIAFWFWFDLPGAKSIYIFRAGSAPIKHRR